jgi:GH15 family glucan-1,4-alpha-glucosidase
VLARYNGEGARVGWEDYLASLTELPRLREASEDGGKLVQASALMLKVQEDRTYAGALIASLSNPWGDTVDASQSSTGYKAVWPRDFYQCAMALAALGDRQTPLAAFHYLPTVQVKAPRRRAIPATAAGSCRSPGSTARPNGSASSWTRPPCRSCWAGSCGSWAGCRRRT